MLPQYIKAKADVLLAENSRNELSRVRRFGKMVVQPLEWPQLSDRRHPPARKKKNVSKLTKNLGIKRQLLIFIRWPQRRLPWLIWKCDGKTMELLFQQSIWVRKGLRYHAFLRCADANSSHSAKLSAFFIESSLKKCFLPHSGCFPAWLSRS